MVEENFNHQVKIQEKYGPALSALGQISELERDLSQTDDQNLIQSFFFGRLVENNLRCIFT